MNKSSKNKLAGFAFFFLVTVLVVVCSFVAALFNAFSPVVYESHAVFQIKPKVVAVGEGAAERVDALVALCDFPHEQHITSKQYVAACLNARSLFVLDSFVGKNATQIIESTVSNLRIEELKPDSNIYRVTCRSSNPQDCSTLLHNLIQSYRDVLQAENAELTHHFDFKHLAVARVGEQTSPVLPYSIAVGIGLPPFSVPAVMRVRVG